MIKTAYGEIPEEELIIKLIPDYPKVKLNNYFLKFYDPNIDTPNTSIKVKLYDEKCETRIISLINNNKIPSLEEIDYFRAGSSPHKIKLPTYLTPKLAYFVGYFLGDGGLKDIRRSYDLHGRYEHKMIVGDEFELQVIHNIHSLFEQLFKIKTKIRYEKKEKGIRFFYINPTNKVIYRFLVKIFDFKEGPKKDMSIPSIIKDSPPELIKWFLRGIFDADGGVSAAEKISRIKGKKRYNLRIKLADKKLIEELHKFTNQLFNLGLNGPYSEKEKYWYIQCSKKGILKAYKQDLFIHPIKNWRLRKLCKINNK